MPVTAAVPLDTNSGASLPVGLEIVLVVHKRGGWPAPVVPTVAFSANHATRQRSERSHWSFSSFGEADRSFLLMVINKYNSGEEKWGL